MFFLFLQLLRKFCSGLFFNYLNFTFLIYTEFLLSFVCSSLLLRSTLHFLSVTSHDVISYGDFVNGPRSRFHISPLAYRFWCSFFVELPLEQGWELQCWWWKEMFCRGLRVGFVIYSHTLRVFLPYSWEWLVCHFWLFLKCSFWPKICHFRLFCER